MIDDKLTGFDKELAKIVAKVKKDVELAIAQLPAINGNFDSLKFDEVQLLQINDSIITSLEANGYNDLIANQLGDMRKELTNRVNDLRKAGFEQLGEVRASDLDNLINYNATEFGRVTQDISEKIQTQLAQQILAGSPLEETIPALATTLSSDLKRYSETWMRTAYQQYQQKVEDTLANEIGYGEEEDDEWEYIGAPLQNNSHSECVWALRERKDNIFTTKEKEAFQTGNAYGGQPAPPRYNCQHYFVMSPKDLRDKLSKIK